MSMVLFTEPEKSDRSQKVGAWEGVWSAAHYKYKMNSVTSRTSKQAIFHDTQCLRGVARCMCAAPSLEQKQVILTKIQVLQHSGGLWITSQLQTNQTMGAWHAAKTDEERFLGSLSLPTEQRRGFWICICASDANTTWIYPSYNKSFHRAWQITEKAPKQYRNHR